MQTIVLLYRRFFVVGLHIALIILSNYSALWLRFDGKIELPDRELWLQMLPWLILIRGVTFIPLRLYEGLWRYTGIWDLRNIIVGVVSSSIIFFSVVHFGFGATGYPRSVFIIDSLLLIFFMGGIRLARRLYQGLLFNRGRKRLLIYGAGDSGELVARDIRNNSSKYESEVAGFIDDDPNKIGRRIHGAKVLGTRKDIANIIATVEPDEILIAIRGAAGATLREVIRVVEPFKIPIKTLPSITGDQSGTFTFNEVREVSFEDLLDRPSVGGDLESVEQLVSGKRILITGAGGSIGSELCRQVAAANPKLLVMLDKNESGLYAIEMELSQKFPSLAKVPILGDIKHLSTLDELFVRHQPQIVFHAAAYKHVPMMELHPEEAVLNNVTGTYRLSQAAIKHKAERFVLISTDKAVNPTNVMGATKRAGEVYTQSLVQAAAHGETIFSAVRFGNVLGSNGSVVPLFLQQIRRGGPVTVTHPEVTRYFMTIPEAVQLVLRAATLGSGGEIFVLEMGEQIKVVNMARHLIRICGLVPDKDISINFVGLRPGEKLQEELVGADETQQSSPIDKIYIVRPASIPRLDFVVKKILEMERAAIENRLDAMMRLLRELVPTFHPLEPDIPAQTAATDKPGVKKKSTDPPGKVIPIRVHS
jgi:FlaA1/EpsC-like NDP-sugar epimerase